jgi:hypothetical protein
VLFSRVTAKKGQKAVIHPSEAAAKIKHSLAREARGISKRILERAKPQTRPPFNTTTQGRHRLFLLGIHNGQQRL